MRLRLLHHIVAVMVGVSVLTACGGDDGNEPAVTHIAAELLDEVQLAIAELVADGVALDALSVRIAEQVTWPDGAIGCPEPGGMYTQALVPGYRIVIDTPDGEVAFHGETGGLPVRCAMPREPLR
jgi:hypothetical protein